MNKKGNQATIKAISKGTARIYCGRYDLNYINITVTSDQLTVKFNLNGGNGNVPSNIIAKEGDVITLPSGEGLTYSSYYGGKVFVGWSEIKNPNAEGNYKPGKGGTIYPSGSEYYVSKDVTLYAAWADKNVDAEFYIRLDGIIPTEPQGHDASEYSSAINITDAIKVGTFYTNSTYPGVLPQLNSTPSDRQIKRVYPEYNPETQYVLWYVIKKESTWHVDGVLLDKNKVNLAYDPNAPAGTWKNMPDGRQYTQGEDAIISDKVPTRNGYTFVGWNTSKDGSGVPYKAQDRIQMNEDVTLYAQWIEKNKITINYAVIGNGGIVNRTSESLNPETGEAQGSTAEANKGYRFVGWYYNEACKGEPLTEDVYYKPNRPESGWINGTTFYAKFEPIEAEYTVEYYYQENGQYPEQATSSVTRKGTTDQKVEVTDEDKTPTKAGYVFDDKNENNVLADETLNGDGGTVLKVYFKQQFTVTYAPGDHGTFEPQTTGSLDYGTKTPEFKGETTGAAGYTFTGWDKDIADTVTGNVTYTAQWTRDFKDISVIPFKGTYDGKGHNVKVKGIINGDKVEYSTDGETYSDSLSFVDVTKDKQKVYVRVTNGDQSTVIESYVLITPAPVTVKSGSAKKVYDGTPLTNTKDTSISGLVNGEKVTLTTDGTITDVGSASNTVTIDWGSVKETNYTVTYKFGTLTVTAQSIDPSDPSYLNVKVSKPENKVYDGKDHKWIPEVTLEDGTPLVEGTDYTVTYSTENFKDVQKIKVTIEGTGNYSGTVTRTYKITRKPITVTTDSAIKVYDGSALTADGRVEGIVDGETYGFVITGAQTEVGSSENTYKIEWTGSAKEGNYKITENLGTLTVVPQSIDPEDPTEPEDPDSDQDSEKTDGEDTAAATNVGIFASLATSALAGMGILAALKKRRKN